MVATRSSSFYLHCLSLAALYGTTCAFQYPATRSHPPVSYGVQNRLDPLLPPSALRSSSSSSDVKSTATAEEEEEDQSSSSSEENDSIIRIKPRAMSRLLELKDKRDASSEGPLILRMGVRNGGCSGLSYVMDFATSDDVNDDDEVDDYADEGIRCVVDAKSLLYLYGLELDYSDELIGGGFKFFNPNAEESCGCGSSFGV